MKLIRTTESDLVFLTRSKDAVTTSRVLADRFKKRHDNVLAKNEALRSRSPDVFTDLKIKACRYNDYSGKSNKEYLLNRDAFVWFAMSFTGKKADKFRMEFIRAFNSMESWIKDLSIGYAAILDAIRAGNPA